MGYRARILGACLATAFFAGGGVRSAADSAAADGDGSNGARQALLALERVAVLGASASAGFNVEVELGARTSLAELLPRLLAPQAERRIFDGADPAFFLDPEQRGAAQVERALAFQPRVVLAADFLFWYAYGPVAESLRGERFERGLAQLDRLCAVLLVGDLPNMAGAKSWMMPEAYLPREATLRALNGRLARWAAERERVELLPLFDFRERLRGGRGVSLRASHWEAAEARQLLQWDGLHPSLEGTLFVGALALDALDRRFAGAIAPTVRWDVRELAEQMILAAPTAPAVPKGGG